jgi:hypothetical protein
LTIAVATGVVLVALWLLWSQGMDANEAGAAFEQSANAIHSYRWVLAFVRWCLWVALWWQWDRIGHWMRPGGSDSDRDFRDEWRERRTRMMIAIALVELVIVAGF